jgi:WD40 repeat protein
MNTQEQRFFPSAQSSLLWLLLVFCCLLGACQQAELTLTPTERLTPTVTRVTRTSTPTRIPYRTRTLTPTPTITITPTITLTFTPITPIIVEAHPLALRDSNTWQMKQLNRIGRGTLNDIEYSPDGKYLAVATGLGVYLYDAETLEVVRLIDVDDNVTLIAFNPEGTRLALALESKIEVWDVETGIKIKAMEGEIEGGILNLVFSRGGYIAAIGMITHNSMGLQNKVWQSLSGQLLYHDDNLVARTKSINISLDGKELASYTDWEGMALRKIQTGEKIQDISAGYSFVFSPDGEKSFTTSWWYGEDPTIWMEDLKTGLNTQILTGEYCQYLERNGSSMICFRGGGDFADPYPTWDVIQFDFSDGSLLKKFQFPFMVGDATIKPDGSSLAVVNSNQVKILDTQTGEEIKTFDLSNPEVYAIGLIQVKGQDYYAAASMDDERNLQVWDVVGGNSLQQFNIPGEEIPSIAFSPDRSALASLDNDDILRLWDIQAGNLTFEFKILIKGLWGSWGPLEFRPDGFRIAFVKSTGSDVVELSLQNGNLTVGNLGAGNGFCGFALNGCYSYNKDGHLIKREQMIGEIEVKDLYTAKVITLPYNSNEVSMIEAFAQTSDENYIAAGEIFGGIVVWDVDERKQIRIMRGHEYIGWDGGQGAIRYLEFNPQNDLLVSVGYDNTTRLWNIHTGEELLKLNTCCFAGFTPDGRFLVTAGDGVIRVWGIPPLE